jgi:hypothetical protein
MSIKTFKLPVDFLSNGKLAIMDAELAVEPPTASAADDSSLEVDVGYGLNSSLVANL